MYKLDMINKIGSRKEVLYFMLRMEYYYLRHSMTIEEMERAEQILHDKKITLDDYMYSIASGSVLYALIALEQEVGNTEFVKELLKVEC